MNILKKVFKSSLILSLLVILGSCTNSNCVSDNNSNNNSSNINNSELRNDECSEGLIFVDISNDCLGILGYVGNDIDVVLPEYHNGLKVTNILDYAFSYEEGNCGVQIKSIQISNTIEDIGKCCFSKCTELTSIVIPNSVKRIQLKAFNECSNLTSIVLSNSLTAIENQVFYKCAALTSIKIPSSVTSIGRLAFFGCTSLTSIVVPDTVTYLDYGVFNGCSALESITLPFIGQTKDTYQFLCYPMYGAYAYTSNVYVKEALKTITLSENCIIIPSYSLAECSHITTINIPNTVLSIGTYALYKCSNLTTINYDGTKAKWETIIKGENWDEKVTSYTIHCTDGDITK